MSTVTKRRIFILPFPGIYLLVALICALSIAVTTANLGIGYSSDSFSYLYGAEALRDHGLMSDSWNLVYYPPLLPATLLALNLNTTLVLWMNAALLVANLLTLGYMLTQLNVRPWLGALAILAVGLAPETVARHSSLMSEPLFLLMILWALIFVVKDRLGPALIIAALAPLQRYAGVTLIVACALYILLHEGILRAVIFGGLAMIPFLGWSYRSELAVGNTGRDMSWHPISLAHLRSGAATLGLRFWLIPLGVVIMGMAWQTRDRIFTRTNANAPLQRVREFTPKLIRAALIYIFIYLAFLVASISLFDFLTPLNTRILSPVLILGWLVATWLLDQLLTENAHTVWRGVITVTIAGYMIYGLMSVIDYNQHGIGLARRVDPAYFDIIATIPSNKAYLTNDVSTLALMRELDDRLDRGIDGVPVKYSEVTQLGNTQYDEQFAAIAERIMNGSAVLIYFEDSQRDPQPSVEEFTALGIPMQRYDGLILFGMEPQS